MIDNLCCYLDYDEKEENTIYPIRLIFDDNFRKYKLTFKNKLDKFQGSLLDFLVKSEPLAVPFDIFSSTICTENEIVNDCIFVLLGYSSNTFK